MECSIQRLTTQNLQHHTQHHDRLNNKQAAVQEYIQSQSKPSHQPTIHYDDQDQDREHTLLPLQPAHNHNPILSPVITSRNSSSQHLSGSESHSGSIPLKPRVPLLIKTNGRSQARSVEKKNDQNKPPLPPPRTKIENDKKTKKQKRKAIDPDPPLIVDRDQLLVHRKEKRRKTFEDQSVGIQDRLKRELKSKDENQKPKPKRSKTIDLALAGLRSARKIETVKDRGRITMGRSIGIFRNNVSSMKIKPIPRKGSGDLVFNELNFLDQRKRPKLSIRSSISQPKSIDPNHPDQTRPHPTSTSGDRSERSNSLVRITIPSPEHSVNHSHQSGTDHLHSEYSLRLRRRKAQNLIDRHPSITSPKGTPTPDDHDHDQNDSIPKTSRPDPSPPIVDDDQAASHVHVVPTNANDRAASHEHVLPPNVNDRAASHEHVLPTKDEPSIPTEPTLERPTYPQTLSGFDRDEMPRSDSLDRLIMACRDDPIEFDETGHRTMVDQDLRSESLIGSELEQQVRAHEYETHPGRLTMIDQDLRSQSLIEQEVRSYHHELDPLMFQKDELSSEPYKVESPGSYDARTEELNPERSYYGSGSFSEDAPGRSMVVDQTEIESSGFDLDDQRNGPGERDRDLMGGYLHYPEPLSSSGTSYTRRSGFRFGTEEDELNVGRMMSPTGTDLRFVTEVEVEPVRLRFSSNVDQDFARTGTYDHHHYPRTPFLGLGGDVGQPVGFVWTPSRA